MVDAEKSIYLTQGSKRESSPVSLNLDVFNRISASSGFVDCSEDYPVATLVNFV